MKPLHITFIMMLVILTMIIKLLLIMDKKLTFGQHRTNNTMLTSQFELSEQIKYTTPHVDEFKLHMCRERRHRMDWQEMLKPCIHYMKFSTGMYSRRRTSVEHSFILDLNIKATGEYSSFRIQTYDYDRMPKTRGGDTWRVFVHGPSALEAYVYDLDNGLYETSFLLIEEGEYNITVILEGSLCSSYVDPPPDWFKKGDYNGHFQEFHHYKTKQGWPFLMQERMWFKLSSFQVKVVYGTPDRTKYNLSKLRNWQQVCDIKLNCHFLWDGLGRWTNSQWIPYALDTWEPDNSKNERQQKGLLWIYGDCYAFHFFESVVNTTLCSNLFQACNKTYNWVYPRQNPDPKKDKTLHWLRHQHIDLSWLNNYFKNVLDNSKLNNQDSAMLLNLGLHFIRSTTFINYKKLIDSYIEIIKHHQTKVVWKSTTAIYRPDSKAHKRFQTNQRALLFNAYAMSKMCEAGIPIIDVFPMTSSVPEKPRDGIHYNINMFKPVEEILLKYFKYA